MSVGLLYRHTCCHPRKPERCHGDGIRAEGLYLRHKVVGVLQSGQDKQESESVSSGYIPKITRCQGKGGRSATGDVAFRAGTVLRSCLPPGFCCRKSSAVLQEDGVVLGVVEGGKLTCYWFGLRKKCIEPCGAWFSRLLPDLPCCLLFFPLLPVATRSLSTGVLPSAKESLRRCRGSAGRQTRHAPHDGYSFL